MATKSEIKFLQCFLCESKIFFYNENSRTEKYKRENLPRYPHRHRKACKSSKHFPASRKIISRGFVFLDFPFEAFLFRQSKTNSISREFSFHSSLLTKRRLKAENLFEKKNQLNCSSKGKICPLKVAKRNERKS